MKSFLFPFLFLFNACVYLTFDDSKASPLVLVSRTPTPAAEEVRSFVQYKDLVYVAAGSGGILVYRTVGDQMQDVPSLSLKEIYANGLDLAFIRTVEIVEGINSTNLIFSFDTVMGGGIGIAEISETQTKIMGELVSLDGVRIRRTDSRADPDGGFIITAANEYTGVVTYKLSIVSNNVFDQQNLASLAGYVIQQGLGGSALPFKGLQAPGADTGQPITNFEGILALFQKDPERALSIATNLPFLTPAQQDRIKTLKKNTGILTNKQFLDTAKEFLGKGNIENVTALANQFLGEGVQNPLLPEITQNSSNTSNLSPEGLITDSENISNLSPAEETNLALLVSNMLEMKDFEVNPELVNTSNFNPFITYRPIKNAKEEIDRTAKTYGQQNLADDQGLLKEKLQSLDFTAQNAVFETLFNQSDLLTRLVPLLEKSGFNPRQLYQFWQEGRINEIIEKLDTALLADMIKLLPQVSVVSKLTPQITNAQLPSVRNMSVDGKSLYLALGTEGFAVVDRGKNKIIKTVKLPFSEVEDIVPFEAYGQDYIAIADRLNGLSVYARERNNKPGEMVAHLNLVGEGLSLSIQDTLLWLADGSNGVLSIRFKKDKTLSIESEFFDKTGIARYVDTARSREALVSYGADGFARLRYTNINVEEGITSIRSENKKNQKTLAQWTLDWNENSSFFQFLRRLF